MKGKIKKKQSAKAKKASQQNINNYEDREKATWLFFGGMVAIIGGIIGAGINQLF